MVTNGLWFSLAIPYITIRITENLAPVMAGTLTITLGCINALLYLNWCYNSFVFLPINRGFYVLLSNGNGTPVITYVCCSTFIRFVFASNFQEIIVYESQGLPIYMYDYMPVCTRFCVSLCIALEMDGSSVKGILIRILTRLTLWNLRKELIL
jgi:hypothetical protein